MDDLTVTLELVGAAKADRVTLLCLRVENRGSAPRTLSARLNLFEGDVRLICRAPSGTLDRFDGWQIDTLPKTVELPPSHTLAGTLDLLETAQGPVLREAGHHEIVAEYFPAVGSPPVASAPLSVESGPAVAAPGDEALARLLADRWLRRALVKADAREAPEAMNRLASGFPATTEGELAALIIAGGGDTASRLPWADLAARHGVRGLALLLLALRTPYSPVGLHLAAAFETALATLTADRGELEPARRLVRQEPIAA